jgi:hypothetical protein
MKRNLVKIPEKVLAWRERQRKGSIMKPATFRGIKRKAARGGYAIPSAVGGKAYWVTVLRKYLDEFQGDKTAMRTLNKLLGKRKSTARKFWEGQPHWTSLLGRKRKNPSGKKWYVGGLKRGGPKVFSSLKRPTMRSHGKLFMWVVGPFKGGREEAYGYASSVLGGGLG